MRNSWVMLAMAACLAVVWGTTYSFGHPKPGVDYPVNAAAFWDLDTIDYADDGNTYTYRQLAGGSVYDHRRHVEDKPITMEYVQQVLNTSTQIANQVTDLADKSPEAMLVQALGIEEDFKNISDTLTAFDKSQQAIEDMVTQMGLFFEGKTSLSDNLQDPRKRLGALDKIYRDTFEITKKAADIDKKSKRLKKLLEDNKNVRGNKDMKQLANQIQSEKIVLDTEEALFMGAFATAVTAAWAVENFEEAEAARTTFNAVSLGVADPYNPTKQDKKNYERPQGKGFVRF